MNARSRAILICSLSAIASVLCPLSGAAQPAYSVIDLGKAPEPVIPEPYNFSNDSSVEFMAGNPSGQTIISRFVLVDGDVGATQKSFFWEPGLSAPLRIGSNFDGVIAAAISRNGFVVGTINSESPFVWSKTAGQVNLEHGASDFLLALAVNSSAIVVGVNRNLAPHRAVIWYQNRQLVYLERSRHCRQRTVGRIRARTNDQR